MKLSFVPLSEIQRLRRTITDPVKQVRVLATVFRINTLYMIAQAGSGHIGSSFSAMDIVTWLHLNVLGKDDVYFSSKGHDAPGLYSILLGLEKIPFEKIHTLRRLGGLPGHPDIVNTPCIVTNTGSLGMGIAKARGMALARRLNKRPGRFFVLTGDGELQEGQNWESLQPTANGHYGEITVIVDHNKMQSDTWVKKVSDLGNLEKKFAAFGWEVARIDGHNLLQFSETLERFNNITDKPKVIIADTIKGKGVSFMEGNSLGEDELYKFHSGAPSADNYAKALTELLKQVEVTDLVLEQREALAKYTTSSQPQKLISAYGAELKTIGDEHAEVVVLDADLMLDTGLIPFKEAHPDRFVECGIAEQDMVSLAGGLALSGKLPIVHSFACFLSTRPNEQIYNNATEETKIIYAGSLAGILPAGPGHSHQSVRDISILGSIPGLTLIAPSCEQEVRLTLRWAVEKNPLSTYIRLESLPIDLPFSLPKSYSLQVGLGQTIYSGHDIALVGYGPTLLKQAYLAAQQLAKENISVAVYDFPWLNNISDKFITELCKYQTVLTLDNHYLQFSQGMMIRAHVPQAVSLGLTDVPVCGQNDEVLTNSGLDISSIINVVKTHSKK
ncbi:MAG: 1-deoxy-D-xylulose-5-phosphate synthase N-terminal domain-containing protein [Patescibacteria group bacterium]|jgi:transketolase